MTKMGLVRTLNRPCRPKVAARTSGPFSLACKKCHATISYCFDFFLFLVKLDKLGKDDWFRQGKRQDGSGGLSFLNHPIEP